MSGYCEDCGCKVYNGHCVNCHEETYIALQNASNDEPIAFSKEFTDKLVEQEQKAKAIKKQNKYKHEQREITCLNCNQIWTKGYLRDNIYCPECGEDLSI